MGDASDGLSLHRACIEQLAVLRDFNAGQGRAIVERHANDADGKTVQGIFLRAFAWVDSLCRLTTPADFQGIAAGSRALLEICVDLTLLAHDRARFPASHVLAWEESAKLKAGERMSRRHPDVAAAPPYVQDAIAFVGREGARIRAARQQIWGTDRNGRVFVPDRWTNRSLETDVAEADRLRPEYRFAEFYDERFAQLCWHTHGSGLAAVRNIPAHVFPGIAAVAAAECVRFGFIATELTFHYFGLESEPITFERLRALATEGQRVSREALNAPTD